MRKSLVWLVVLLLLNSGVSSRTRISSIHNYLDDLRLNEQGFANSISDPITIESSTFAIEIATILSYDLDNPEDIILFYQSSQNADYGFGNTPSSSSDFSSSINAVHGLVKIGINSSQLGSWRIAEFVNGSAYTTLFVDLPTGNETISVLSNFTIPILSTWYDYLFTMFLLNTIPNLPLSTLTTNLLGLQLENGTYASFEYGVFSILLLKMLGYTPRDLELSSLYLQAFIQQDGLFGFDEIGPSSLEATYLALLAFQSLGLLQDIWTKQKMTLKILDQQLPNSGFSDLDSDIPNLRVTWLSVNILEILDATDELLRPDVLQTDGFIVVNFIPIAFALLFWRRKHE